MADPSVPGAVAATMGATTGALQQEADRLQERIDRLGAQDDYHKREASRLNAEKQVLVQHRTSLLHEILSFDLAFFFVAASYTSNVRYL